MTDLRRTRLPASLSAKISSALGSLWTEYSAERPTEVRTEIRGNVVTCRLIDAVGAFNRSMIAVRTNDNAREVGELALADY